MAWKRVCGWKCYRRAQAFFLIAGFGFGPREDSRFFRDSHLFGTHDLARDSSNFQQRKSETREGCASHGIICGY